MRFLPTPVEESLLVRASDAEERRVDGVADIHAGEVLHEVIERHSVRRIYTAGFILSVILYANGR